MPVFSLALATPAYAQSDYDWDWEYSTDTTDSSGVFSGIGLVMWCCIMACALIIPVALAFFVYKDAQKSGTDNPTLWALLTFFFGLIGLLLYFLVGKKK